MINKKTIKGIKGIIEKNRIRPALETVQVKNGVMTASDLSTTIKINGVNVANGCYTIAQIENNCMDKIKFDADDFPNIEARKDLECIEFEASLFEGIKSVLFAVADPENIACNGVRIVSNGEKLIFIATDTYRMLKVEYQKDLPKFEITLAEKTCKTIIDIMSTETADIKLYTDRIEIFQDNFVIIARLIEMAFPNWSSVYGSINTENTLLFSNSELSGAIKELLPIAKNNTSAKNGAVFKVINNTATLFAENNDMKKNIKIDTIATGNNEKNVFALNIKSIQEYLKIANHEINVKYSNEKAVFVIDDNYLIMPLALASFEVV